MKKTMKLRLIGGVVLLINLWLIGRYYLEGIPVLLLTLGFAGAIRIFGRTPYFKSREKRLSTGLLV